MTDKLREAAQQAERAAFESHWYDTYHSGSVIARSDGTYMHHAVQSAWEAWQARAALAQQDAQPELEAARSAWLAGYTEAERQMMAQQDAQQDAQAVPQGEAIVEEFSAWLNERRGMSVAWVFHDVVAKFRAMLNAAPTPPVQQDAREEPK